MQDSTENVVIRWADERERGVFDALADTLRSNPNLPGALGRAVYQNNLTELIDLAVIAHELYPPGHRMRRYLKGYVSEVESILREGSF